MEEYVILVDENDNMVGTAEKMDAHINPRLHRAFSIIIVNSKDEVLIQKRALDKYHTPGLWANTCCSHPRPGEELDAAAHRRLQEEMGFDTELAKVFSFIYEARFENGVTEKEYDHVLFGRWDGTPIKNPAEVADYKWMAKNALTEDIKKNPEMYTPWFRIAWEKLLAEKVI